VRNLLESFLQVSLLYDFYGALLTDKQRKCIEMHFLNDFSLSEIADEFGVSRQAIYDIINRTRQMLVDYEGKLGLVRRYQTEQECIQDIFSIMKNLPDDIKKKYQLEIVIHKLSSLISDDKEE
jgi:uncharacterized protein